jgi:microcystin-dependent protein
MKKYLLIIVLQWMVVESFSQAGVGIGVPAPDASAALHVQPPTNNKGMLIPRLTTNERNLIAAPAEGLLVYDTDVNSLFHFNGTWQQVGVPAGAIMMWSGTVPPAGWALCNGSGGTPDLRERFIVGAGGENTTQPVAGTGYNVGDNAGQNLVTLTANEMPSHTHVINSDGAHTHSYQAPLVSGSHPGGSNGFDRPNGLDPGVTGSSGFHSHTMNSAGGNQAHENRPPYYALAFIIKL